MGQGLTISNIRNRIKPNNHQGQLLGNKMRVIQIPTISSQTIPPWSCTPSSSATRPHSQTPKILALTIQAIASHSGNICSAGTNTKPAKVPQVPGAFLAKPEPKPKAKKCQKLRQTLWACMGRVFLNKNADNHCADASPCVLRCQ